LVSAAADLATLDGSRIASDFRVVSRELRFMATSVAGVARAPALLTQAADAYDQVAAAWLSPELEDMDALVASANGLAAAGESAVKDAQPCAK
jgi:hypothetical protein